MIKQIIFNRLCIRNIAYVPSYNPPDVQDTKRLRDFVSRHNKLLILTGAGISTESGIPDYRSEGVGLYARSNHKPVQYQEFVKYAKVRQRYWARNFVGWPRFSSIQPNKTHFAIKELEKMKIRYKEVVRKEYSQCKGIIYIDSYGQFKGITKNLLNRGSRYIENGKVTAIVTQNVDRLHHKAGSKNIIELHGSGYIVKCLNCPYEICRHKLQEILHEKNPDMKNNFSMIRPDGDVELSDEDVEKFKAPICPECSGSLKPDIVFFGDNVPKVRVDLVRKCVTDSDAIFVLGSSLTVYSSYRIILQAKEENKSVALLNIGPTRADGIVDLKISTKCGDILTDVCKSL